MGAGLSAAGIGTFFERFRPLFLIIAAVLLGLGFYLNYFRKERCEAGSTCERPDPRFRKMNRGMLWVSTALVLAFVLFPSYAERLFGVRPTAAGSTVASTDTWTIDIEGMTCAGCEAAVNQSLAEVPGVLSAKASYDAAGATITVDSSDPPTRMALAAAVGTAGYRLVSVAEPPAATETGPKLAGRWVTELEDQNGEMIEVIMDLGVVNSRWVGEFDLPKYNVVDYPVEVKATGDTIELFLTAIGMSFKGSIDDDGVLTGVGQSPGAENESISFRRTGPAEFSEGFLELEAAADDPSLLEILSDGGGELRKRFNADSEKTRLLMLLSPTCPGCQRGARVVQDDVISKIASRDFLVYAVWEPILETDDERSARKAVTLFPNERVKQYWVRSRAVGELFQPPINLEGKPAWDVYLVYAPGIVWDGDTPPEPTFFMHQLGGRLPDDQRLDGSKLRDVIEKILNK